MIDVARDPLIPLYGPPFKGRESVASRFGKSRATVDRWRTSGQLQCERVGGRWFTNAESINEFAKSSSGGSSGETRRKRKRRRNPEHAAAAAELERRFGT